jgi:hypothetical protein
MTNESCDLAFAAFRDLSRSPWKPFCKAALERNPVIVGATKELSLDECYHRLEAMPMESIYPEPFRMAQPDEVWNFGRGDGLEQAIAMATLARAREPNARMQFDRQGTTVTVAIGKGRFSFSSRKNLELPREEDTEFPVDTDTLRQ